MENIELNRKAVQILADWDPFHLGPNSYDTETADVIAALQGIDNAKELAEIIRKVYEFSFEQWIPLDDCFQIAEKLVQIRYEATCSL